MTTAMRLIGAAIKVITTIQFFENYMSTGGRISWDTYKERLIQATQ